MPPVANFGERGFHNAALRIKGKRMKQITSTGIALILFVAVLSAQSSQPLDTAKRPIEGRSRTEVVDELWRMATEGELLTPEGWSEACKLYTNPTPFPGNKVILIMSNSWGLSSEHRLKNETVAVELGYTDVGKIDSLLRFTPSPKAEFMKTVLSYNVVAVPAFYWMTGPDGKTPVEKKFVGYRVWQIEGTLGLPWTTVNTAIRYVLEVRNKTADPIIKKNAEQTLAELLEFH